jgi:hypothetical protein
VSPEPFEDVQYYAPYKSDGVSLNTLRSNEALLDNVTALTWGLREVLQYAEVLLNKDDIDAKADALIDFIKEMVLDKRFVDPMLERPHTVTSFADLDAWFKDVLRALEKKDDQSWRTHHVGHDPQGPQPPLEHLAALQGLVADDGATSDLPFGSFQDRTVYVIDVAGLEEDAQDLIFARVVTKLREHLEKRDLGVQHVVVFVDELNKYAPGDGPETYVRKMLLDIAERGRYLGLVLFAAQQFRSQVHRRVVGNSGTALYGRMDGDELATPGYAVLSPAIKTKLATLEKGQLMVRHPHFTQPIFVRFPRPAIMRGRDGVSRYPAAQTPSLHAAVLRTLRTLDPSLTARLAAGRDAARDRTMRFSARATTWYARVRETCGASSPGTSARPSRRERPCERTRRHRCPPRPRTTRTASDGAVRSECRRRRPSRNDRPAPRAVARRTCRTRVRGAERAGARRQCPDRIRSRHPARLHPRVGDTLRTRLDQLTEIVTQQAGGGSANPMTSKVMVLTRTIVQASRQATTTVLTVVDSAQVRSSDVHGSAMSAQAEKLLRGQRLIVQLAEDGSVKSASDASGAAVTRDVAEAMAAMPAVLPRRAVVVGERWHREMPLPSAGPIGAGGNAQVRA